MPVLLALAACDSTGEPVDVGLAITTNVKVGRDRDERRGIERAGDVCLIRDRDDRGGARISHAC